jgi:hypothetical protein
MSESAQLLRHQTSQARCRHPQGERAEFARGELERSIGARFQRVARLHPDRLALFTKHERLSYRQLDKAS